jgi:tripartite-type tricarboxylate transporter receptor subunit TctC
MTGLARGFAALIALACGVAGPTAALAQTYPDRPIRVIVPIAAGSVTDVIMRAMAAELAPRLGQQLVVDNRGGAAGIPGAQACAAAAPDGATFCLVYHSTLSINPLVFSKLPYNADTDFVPITSLFLLVEGLFANAGLNANSVAELKALVQANPTGLNYGTLGPGSYPDLFLRWLNNEWKAGIVGVPYRGGGPIAQELAAGQLQMAKMGVGNFMGVLSAGKVKPLAVAAPKRSPLLPDVPTFAEAGLAYPGWGWWGVAAPKGTPQPVIDRLNAEFTKLLREPKMVEYLEKQAVVPAPATPAEFVAFLKQDRQDAASLVGLSKLTPEEYKPN